MKTLILIMLLLSNTVFAQSSTILNRGDIAPYKGILLTHERAEKATKAEKANIVLKDLRIAHMELIRYHKDDAKLSRKRLSEAEFDSNLKSIGMFVLGVVLTGFAFKVNQKIGDI